MEPTTEKAKAPTITVKVEHEVGRVDLIDAVVMKVHENDAPTSRRTALKLARDLLWQHGTDREGHSIFLAEVVCSDAEWSIAEKTVDDLFPELMPGDIDGKGGPS